MPISDRHMRWLESRKIDPETASRQGLFTDRDALVFPYLEHGKRVSAKFRGANKTFWQQKDGRKTFWNSDVLDDPAVLDGSMPLIITEGEMDALTCIECGFPLAVSVPQGAPAVTEDEIATGVIEEPKDNPEDDREGDYQFAYNNRFRLQKVKRFIIATDNDLAGRKLAQGLVYRLGAVRCSWVQYPEGCKDLNDVLMQRGTAAVVNVLNNAKPYPVKGLYKLSEFPEQLPLKRYATGFSALTPDPDDRTKPGFYLYPGAFVVVSGLAGGGKTALMTQVAFNMARLHKWRICIASFEMHVRPILEEMLIGFYWPDVPKRDRTPQQKAQARAFIEEHFSFICLAPDDEDTEADVDWVLDRASDAVMRYDADMLLLDPWNEVEHRRRSGESVADYTNRAIRSMRRFAHSKGVCTVVVAHPTKEGAKGAKNGEPIGLYDISDGATWANKAELGLIVHRQSPTDTLARVGIRKVKFHESGKVGDVFMTFDQERRAFQLVE